MIYWPGMAKLLGFFVLGVSACLIIPLGYALFHADAGAAPLLWSFLIGTALGSGSLLLIRTEVYEVGRKEGILFVVLAWVAAVTVGGLPLYFSPHVDSFADAIFESVSGFTTTGATILTDIEAVPESLLLWRAMTHWIGGMGIIVLGIAILPLVGTGGMELYRAEFSGARSEKLKPRIAETALSLWKIYVAFTLAEYVALRLAGMSAFDSVCHSFATMATGGFSTRGISIEAYQSPLIESIIVVFMIIAGINFTQHYRLLVERKPRSFFSDAEIRAYGLVILLSTAAITVSLYLSSKASIVDAFRLSIFQVASIITTTGFSSTDFEQWTPFATFILLVLMFIGGCTGSTAGGMKTARIALLLRVVGREFKRMTERRGIFAVRFGGRAVSENTVQSVLNLVYLAFIINFAACICLTALGLDLITAFSAVAASMFNIGPGLGTVGPAENYHHLPTLAKWVLSFCMLAGRLEFYTVFVIMTPMFWRK
ncbi:MAG: TrkH family potassium uptake protein [Acidobacteriota bacterium]|nr:MAG: TrkH family potassium uptake protein [Acidobacteriota bacterium]